MAPIIRPVLSTLLSPAEAEKIDIIANDVKFLDPEQKGEQWEIVYRHPDSGYGHDKSKAILPYRDLPSKPTLFFCGDGVSGGSSDDSEGEDGTDGGHRYVRGETCGSVIYEDHGGGRIGSHGILQARSHPSRPLQRLVSTAPNASFC